MYLFLFLSAWYCVFTLFINSHLMPLPLTPLTPPSPPRELASQKRGQSQPTQPHLPTRYWKEWWTHYLREGASGQTGIAGCQIECSMYECFWLCQHNQCNPFPFALERVLTTRTPKMIKVCQAFKKCVNGTKLSVEIPGFRWEAGGHSNRMLLEWQHPVISISLPLESIQVLGELLWKWHSRWVSLALGSVNRGEAMNLPHSLTARTHLLYLAQSFQRNFS